MPEARKRPCAICRRWFRPDGRVGSRQHACGNPECQTSRRQKTQASWRRRNPGYAIAWRVDRRAAQTPLSGVNYFFALTTTISPGQRQLLLALRAARSAAARPLLKIPPLHRRGDPEGSSIKLVSSLLPQAVGAVEKWESWFWISTFPPPTIPDSLLACCSV